MSGWLYLLSPSPQSLYPANYSPVRLNILLFGGEVELLHGTGVLEIFSVDSPYQAQTGLIHLSQFDAEATLWIVD